MPRKAPTKVIEHRVTFGDFERKEFKETLDIYDKRSRLNTHIKTAGVVGAVGLGCATAWIGFQIVERIWGKLDDIIPSLDEIPPAGIWDAFKYKSGLMSKSDLVDRAVAREENESLSNLFELAKKDPAFQEKLDQHIKGDNPPKTGVPFTDWVISQLWVF